MTNIKEQLLYILEDLNAEDLKKFQWHLTNSVEDDSRIPKSQLKNTYRHDTVDKMMQKYGPVGAVEITLFILNKMNLNYLAETLRTKHSENKAAEIMFGYKNHAHGGIHMEEKFTQFSQEEKVTQLRMEHAGKMRNKPGLRNYVCDLTLDPNTAHTLLSLSEGNRKVTRVGWEQSYPDHPARFDYLYQVLCRESLTGRCYWEVEWSEDAAIAVTYKGISRKGVIDDCVFGFNVKSWSLYCYDNSYTVWHNKKRTDISAPPSSSNRVGVYLDWPAGTLSFYSVSSHTLTHLHTFHSTFTEPLYAGFRLWWSHSSVCVRELE